MRISYFITPHGFGHAARAAAVMEAVHRLDPRIEFELFTKVPKWFFEESLSREFLYRPLLTDVGLVQTSPFAADFRKTLHLLNHFYPFDSEITGRLSRTLSEGGSRLVLCDISPMGIVAAKKAGIPCVLVESFTWDWIYEGYAAEHDGFCKHIEYLKTVYSSADHRIQTEPVCRPCKALLTTRPASRKPRTPASQIRKKLGIRKDARFVLVTAGGIPSNFCFPERVPSDGRLVFLVSGAGESTQAGANVIALPHRSGFFHPDLVNASDAVVGKAGYSTVAEVYWAGVPFGYVSRKDFRESEFLASFIEEKMKGLEIKEEELYEGSWMECLPRLLSMKRLRPEGANGADQIAEAVLELAK